MGTFTLFATVDVSISELRSYVYSFIYIRANSTQTLPSIVLGSFFHKHSHRHVNIVGILLKQFGRKPDNRSTRSFRKSINALSAAVTKNSNISIRFYIYIYKYISVPPHGNEMPRGRGFLEVFQRF